VEVVHADPQLEQSMRETFVRLPFAMDVPARVIRTGQPELVPEVSPALLEKQPDPDLFRRAGLGSFLCLPLKTRSGTVGALTLARRTPRSYDENDLVWAAQALAYPIGLSIENRRLSAEARELFEQKARLADRTGQADLEGRLRQSQRLEAVGQLAGGIAHDFNNLLTVIIGCADLLKTDMVSPAAGQHDPLDELIKAARRAASLTQQLLAFSRRQVMQPRLLQLNDHFAPFIRCCSVSCLRGWADVGSASSNRGWGRSRAARSGDRNSLNSAGDASGRDDTVSTASVDHVRDVECIRMSPMSR
jgi:signal transduction histidine kinase